jgi:hypothetical protein
MTGALGPNSHIFIAVIANNLSTVSVFSLDVTDDGDAIFGACPCFGDQPLIGADANGFYISTNSFNTAQRTFRGAQIYALPLAALETVPPGVATAVRFGDLTQAGEPGFSIQPAFHREAPSNPVKTVPSTSSALFITSSTIG